mgnify:CR=1 FL=1
MTAADVGLDNATALPFSVCRLQTPVDGFPQVVLMIDGYHLCSMHLFLRVPRNVFLLSALETIIEGVPFSQDIWDRQLNHVKSSLQAANPHGRIMDEEGW